MGSSGRHRAASPLETSCLWGEYLEAKVLTLADSHFFMSINPQIICTYIKYYWIDISSYISIE
jgi:hypothetical protein